MSIRLAAPRHAMRYRLARATVRAAGMVAANDNPSDVQGAGAAAPSIAEAATLNAALRHFARHGLAAAERACAAAQAARDTGDEQGFAWWLSICNALDRRMARELARPAR